MSVSALLARAVLGMSVAASMQVLPMKELSSLTEAPSPKPAINLESEYAKLPACAPIKGKPAVRAKSPDVLGAKATTKTLQCFTKADVAAGKKILNGFDRACFACHSTLAQYNPQVMIANLRAQGDGTLSLANITAVNNAHLDEMSGSVATAKELKQVRAYLKSFKG